MLVTILFALALSLDCLGVGISYGLRNIIIPVSALLIISCCSGGVLALSMLFGQLLGQFISADVVQYFGAAILVGLGSYVIYKNWHNQLYRIEEIPLFQWNIRPLGIVIQIMREPHRADMDRSGLISSREALWLGVAVSLDSFAAGIGMAFLGYSVWSTSFWIGLSAFLMLYLGTYLGKEMGERLENVTILQYLPGILLIGIGLLRMLL